MIGFSLCLREQANLTKVNVGEAFELGGRHLVIFLSKCWSVAVLQLKYFGQ